MKENNVTFPVTRNKIHVRKNTLNRENSRLDVQKTILMNQRQEYKFPEMKQKENKNWEK